MNNLSKRGSKITIIGESHFKNEQESIKGKQILAKYNHEYFGFENCKLKDGTILISSFIAKLHRKFYKSTIYDAMDNKDKLLSYIVNDNIMRQELENSYKNMNNEHNRLILNIGNKDYIFEKETIQKALMVKEECKFIDLEFDHKNKLIEYTYPFLIWNYVFWMFSLTTRLFINVNPVINKYLNTYNYFNIMLYSYTFLGSI